MRRAALVALSVVALGACQHAADESGELDQAKAQVRTFFNAINEGDCRSLATLYPAAASPGACDKLLHEWREDLHLKLVDIPDVRRDGRDHRAILVNATVMRHDEQKTMLFRVTHENGAWQLGL